MTPIYLDHAATTPLAPEVFEAMRPYLTTLWGNPSSLHQLGRAARSAVTSARDQIAHLLGAQASEIYFTGSGTESDNLVILGIAHNMAPKGRHIITTRIEHPAVEAPCTHLEQQGWEITRLDVDPEGFVSPQDLEAAIRPETILVSILHGNNEMGTLQPVVDLGSTCRQKGVLFHTDAVQTVGKLPLDLASLPVDYLSFSGHKLYGPKGIGGLYVSSAAPLPEPLLYGGGQEQGLRSGTENVAAIVGLAKALEQCVLNMATETPRLHELQTFFIETMEKTFEGTGHRAILNGPRDVCKRVPGNVHFSFTCNNGAVPEGEALVLQLDLKGICVSSGSACHSAVIEPSKIIQALGKSRAEATSTVRFSMGRDTTREDLEKVAGVMPGILNRLAKTAKASV